MAGPQTIVYRTFADAALEMDVCPAEKGDGPRPGVLFIHGGGWSAGKRTQFAWHARELAKAGFVTATASYRLAPAHPYPAALDDCQYAMRWLRAHAAEWNLDPARLGAVGSSAGGHLAACLGVRETRVDDVPALRGFSSRAQCVVDVHGVHDFRALAPNALVKSTVPFLGGTAEEVPGAWTEASPITFVDDQSAPMMLTHDPKDPTVPYAQSVSFAAALIQAARPVEFLPTPGSGHGFVYNPDHAWTRRLWPRAVAWLTEWLQPDTAPAV